MAETVTLNLNGGKVWQPVSTESCRITASESCYYCISSTTPDESQFGHRFDSNETQDIRVGSGQTLYFQCEVPFRITVTSSAMFLAASVFDDWFQAMTEGSKAFIFQNYTEANVKNGLQYFLRQLFTGVAVGATVTVKFQTGAKPVIIKSQEVSFSGSSRVDYQAIEGGTYTGGAVVAIRNENLIAPVPTTVSVTHTGTASGGTPFRDKTIFGSGATTGGGSRIGTDVLGRENVLKPNTLYQVKMSNISGSTADIQLELSWYEGTPDLPA